jgi:hypothetical protein
MRRLTVLAVAVIVAVGTVRGALAFQSGDLSQEPTVTSSVLGDAQAGLTARMDAAEAAGAYSIGCEPGDGHLVCVAVADADVLAALRRGETVYGRTVIGFPGGAKVADDRGARFETTDLVCTDASGDSLHCLSVTEAEPTVRAGAETFVFYKKHNVTFDKNGNPVGHLGAATVPLRVTE